MNSGIIKTIDPQGTEVYLSTDLYADGAQGYKADKLGSMLQKALESPSCVIVMPNQERYYFRSLAWHFTVLVHVTFQEEKWWVVEWLKNPEPAYIQQLLKTGTFITGSNLG